MLGVLPQNLKTVLCLGAHCDDIEIGCGGLLLHLCRARPDLKIVWVVFSSDSVRAMESREAGAKFLADLRDKEIVINEFRNGFFPYIGADIKECFEHLKGEISPDIVLTHFRDDLHQDHRTVSELTWNTFRSQFILEYEIPKYDGDLGPVNFFVPLTEEMARRKVDVIMECFTSQREKRWFDRDLFLALMRLRGMECNAEEGYAEAFYCRKAVLGKFA